MQLKAEAAQRLKGKVAIVTGGGGTNSIGRSISIRYAEEGANVAVADIDTVSAAAVAKEITDGGGVAMPVAVDVRDLASCEAMAKQVADTWGGRIDILVNNAAAYKGFMAKTGFKPFNEWTPEEWDQMHSVNLKGQWYCARAVFPYMKPQGYGKIINMGSCSFFEGIPGFIHYNSTKGGVIGLSRGLGKELGEFGIRVNTIAPGFVLTEASYDLISATPEFAEIRRNAQAIKERNVMAEDLAGPAVFFASEDSDMITCQTLLVEGGGSVY
jgi:NAD(P)-dependent dehydrogenase (short-subunit alcohol dehydrogenase family)